MKAEYPRLRDCLAGVIVVLYGTALASAFFYAALQLSRR